MSKFSVFCGVGWERMTMCVVAWETEDHESCSIDPWKCFVIWGRFIVFMLDIKFEIEDFKKLKVGFKSDL